MTEMEALNMDDAPLEAYSKEELIIEMRRREVATGKLLDAMEDIKPMPNDNPTQKTCENCANRKSVFCIPCYDWSQWKMTDNPLRCKSAPLDKGQCYGLDQCDDYPDNCDGFGTLVVVKRM